MRRQSFSTAFRCLTRLFGSVIAISAVSLVATPLHAAGMNLSWNDCHSGGLSSQVRITTCAEENESNVMYVSFVAPAGITKMVAATSWVTIRYANAVPDWLRQESLCNHARILGSTVFANTTCSDPWGGVQASGVTQVEQLGLDRVRLYSLYAIPASSAHSLNEGSEYYVVRITLDQSFPGTCAGCDVPAMITLDSLLIQQPAGWPGGDVRLRNMAFSNIIYWQGVPTGTMYRDADADGFGDPLNPFPIFGGAIPPGYVANGTDGDDTDPSVYPGAPDLTCDGVDNDGNGTVDDGNAGCNCIERSPGLVGWWRANGNAADAAGFNPGTLTNGATATVAGKVGQAFSFDGIDDYVSNLGTPATYSFIENTGVFTIEGWIRLNDPNIDSQQAIVAHTGSSTDKGIFFLWENLPSSSQGHLRLGIMRGVDGSPTINVSTPDGVITDNGWHHVAVVGTGSTARFYVDGFAYLYNAGATMGPMPTGDATRALDIGRCPDLTPQCQFNGQIDELAIYDRALSGSQIHAVYAAGAAGLCGTGCAQSLTGLVGWWPGESSAADRSSAHHDGSASAGMPFPAGMVGRAFSLDGSSRFVQVSDAPDLRFTSQLTMAAWIKPNDVGSVQQIISKWSSVAGNWAYQMGLYPTGALRMDLSDNGSNYSGGVVVSPSGLVNTGVWKHVAATYGGGVQKLYVNGTLVASHATFPSIYPGVVGLYLGVDNAGVQFFNGLIDEPMVFNRALSAAEIQAIYSAGASGMCGLGLVVGVDEPRPREPKGPFQFAAPWPNPVAGTTKLRIELPVAAAVRAEVFDLAGRHVKLIVQGWLPEGEHQLSWDGRDAQGGRVAPGIYQIRVSAEGAALARRIVLIQR